MKDREYILQSKSYQTLKDLSADDKHIIRNYFKNHLGLENPTLLAVCEYLYGLRFQLFKLSLTQSDEKHLLQSIYNQMHHYFLEKGLPEAFFDQVNSEVNHLIRQMSNFVIAKGTTELNQLIEQAKKDGLL